MQSIVFPGARSPPRFQLRNQPFAFEAASCDLQAVHNNNEAPHVECPVVM